MMCVYLTTKKEEKHTINYKLYGLGKKTADKLFLKIFPLYIFGLRKGRAEKTGKRCKIEVLRGSVHDEAFVCGFCCLTFHGYSHRIIVRFWLHVLRATQW